AVAVARDVLDRDPSILAADPGGGRAARRDELGQPRIGEARAARAARRDLVGRQVAEPTEEVVELIDARHPPVFREALEAELEIGERLRVEQLAQLLLAEQLAEEVAIERTRAGAAP